MERTGIQREMIRSELEEIVGEAYISTSEADRLVYATDTDVAIHSTAARPP